MQYISTRGEAPLLNFEQTMLAGLASDGGLYLPTDIPKMPLEAIKALRGARYEQIAEAVMTPFVGNCFSTEELRGAIERAYGHFGHAARAPLVQLDQNHFLLELFHGPTLAFKDFAMQWIAQMFALSLGRTGQRVTIVGATSGDTGSAAIEAFAGLENINVFILFPNGRVSEVQRRQMTTATHANVHAIAVEGTFDDCQARVKDMFNDADFRTHVGLSGVNSINWARVLAQVVYYFSSALSLGAPDREVDFCVPTGNFGDIFAGYIAKEMGLPIGQLVIATNQNDILDRVMKTGRYEVGEVLSSISPSMDIQVSSNFERALFQAHSGDGRAIAELMHDLKTKGGFEISANALAGLSGDFTSGRADETQTMAQIKASLAQHGELLCPHSAVGVHVAQSYQRGEAPMITLATAHPAKFPDAVEKASGQYPPLPHRMRDLYDCDERISHLDNDLGAIMAHIKEEIAR